MESIKIVTEFVRYKEKLEDYGFDIEVNSSHITIKRRLYSGDEIIVACLNDPIALQGFVQGLECLICDEGDGRMDHITNLIEEKHKDRI